MITLKSFNVVLPRHDFANFKEENAITICLYTLSNSADDFYTHYLIIIKRDYKSTFLTVDIKNITNSARYF